MSYIGNTNTTQAFTPAVDFFNGNGSTTAFTLSRPVASVAQVQAVISNVPQKPGDAYTVSGNTITFTSAPPSGTQNIYVYYTSPITQVIAPGQGTVGSDQLQSSINITTLSTTNGATVQGLTVGRGAGAVSTNTAVGSGALQANTSATGVTAVGYQAGYSNTTGTNNTAFGKNSLRSNTTAADNTALGDAAAYANTTGSALLAVGAGALYSNTTGSYNTAIGRSALELNTTSSYSTAVGYQAGYSGTTNAYYNVYLGSRCGYSATGSQNTFIGDYSGNLITSGEKNTILGRFSGNQNGLDIRTASNYIVLSDGDGNPWVYHNSSVGLNLRGYDASDTSGISFRNSSLTKYWGIATNYADFFIADADFSHYARVSQNFTSWSFGSDRRIKTNIADIEYGLDAVMAIQPRQFDYIASGKHDIGFIAQELKEVIPEAVTGTEIEFSDSDTPQERATKTMGVSKDILIPVLVKAIQELKAEFDAYKEAHP